MKSLHGTVPALMIALLGVVWSISALAPAPAPGSDHRAFEAFDPLPIPTPRAEPGDPEAILFPTKYESVDAVDEAFDCTQNGTVSVRHDFELIAAVYVYGGFEERAERTVPYGPFWTFSDPESRRRAGAELILTWELKRALRNSPCGNHIMAAAASSDPWFTQVRFINPYQSFNGADLVQGFLIQKRVPLGNLQPSGLQGFQPPGMSPLGDNAYRMQFGVVYQAAPTYMTYQDPIDQTIVFAEDGQQAGDGRGGRDRPPPRNLEVLRWTTPITAESLGQTPADYLEGKTISDIVNSRTTGRPDDQLCRNCHHSATSNRYRPPDTRGVPVEITPILLIPRDGEKTYSWNGTGSSESPIVHRFEQSPIGKPVDLEAAFNKWLSDGGLE